MPKSCGDSDLCDEDVKEMKPSAIVGFDGNTKNGFIVHPNGRHVVYPIGNKITIQDWIVKKQTFLVGHTNNISAVCLSATGKYVASGQINHIGFKEHKGPISAIHINKFDTEAASASTDGSCIIWDLERQCRRQILFAKTLFLCVR
ncbi:hypothetical protein D910_05580 [Dendroctonus ponderosae]|uniref:Cilia- and flagella-associated protein 52 n=1 Tax=Dendroctonus ponderosae TaxID=77166 RepID=U4U542_DENPD|nr:hypothetical protein D910_05580 [Dendroctonus ponderosae]